MKYIIGFGLLVVMSFFLACDQTGRLKTIGGPASDPTILSFEEKITKERVRRTVKEKDGDPADLLYEFVGGGNTDFEKKLDCLVYTHRVGGIVPPMLPDGILVRAKLKLTFKKVDHDDCDDRDAVKYLKITADSIEFKKGQTQVNVIDPNDGELEAINTILADGKIEVSILAKHGRKFRLKESRLQIEYYIPEDAPPPILPVPLRLILDGDTDFLNIPSLP